MLAAEQQQQQQQQQQQRGVSLPASPRAPVFPGAFNVLACGCVGCHIADQDAPWILGSAPCQPVAAAGEGEHRQQSPSLPAAESASPSGGGGGGSCQLARGPDKLRVSAGSFSLARCRPFLALQQQEEEEEEVFVPSSRVRLSLHAPSGTLSIANQLGMVTSPSNDSIPTAAGAATAHTPQVVYLTLLLGGGSSHSGGGGGGGGAGDDAGRCQGRGDGSNGEPEEERSELMGPAPLRFVGRGGIVLAAGRTRRHDGEGWSDALTLVCTVPPATELTLGVLERRRLPAAGAGGGGGPETAGLWINTFVFPLEVHPLQQRPQQGERRSWSAAAEDTSSTERSARQQGSGGSSNSIVPAVLLPHWPFERSQGPLLCTQVRTHKPGAPVIIGGN
jgi:hypothetical protein